jgi:hypothetical protein
MFVSDVGPLNTYHHLYHFASYEERDRVRAAAYKNTAWAAAIKAIRPMLDLQVCAAQLMYTACRTCRLQACAVLLT